MSTDSDFEPDPTDGPTDGTAHVDSGPRVRERAKEIVEANPDFSAAAFAGRLFAEMNTPPARATDLYHDLADQDQSDAGGGGVDPVAAETADELHAAAVRRGWEHSYDRTPFENLRALFEATRHVDAPRMIYTSVAWREICGLGPEHIHYPYATLAEQTDLKIPGEVDSGEEHSENGSHKSDGPDRAREKPPDQSATESGEDAAEPTQAVPPADHTDREKAESDTVSGQGGGGIAAHYDRLGELYATLGEIDGWHCPGNSDYYGWYRTRQGPGAWDGEGRAWALGKEFAGIRQELERGVYATVNYAPAEWYMDNWQPFNYGEKGKEWQDEKPTPDYGDLRAYAPFVDIDLADDVKRKRPDGDAPREMVERALSLYLEAFGELAGSMEHVYALDSVGGAYAFVAPTATAPIAEAFDRSARHNIFEDMTDRLNEWLGGVKDDVNAAVPDAVGTFEPDLLNHKNRLYKAPMCIHSSLDGVVTPVDPENPSYDYTPIEAVDDDAIADAEAWADGFTSDHTGAVSAVVENLWPEYYADADGWRDALAAWVEDQREQEERNKDRERQRIPSDEIPDDIERTDDIDVITSKIEAVPVDDLVRRTVGAAVEGESTQNSDDAVRFNPPWRHSESGESCFADSEKFYDPDGAYGGGGPLAFIATERGIIRRPGDKLDGADYWRAVNALRELGYEIPYFEGADGRHRDVLRLFTDPETEEDRKRQLARSLFADR